MNHECDEIKEYVGYNVIEFDEHDKKWRLHLDCHCCSTEINLCPYCGEKLVKE